jgi:hypothetical protein
MNCATFARYLLETVTLFNNPNTRFINRLAPQKNIFSIFVTFSVFAVPYNSRGQIRDYGQ